VKGALCEGARPSRHVPCVEINRRAPRITTVKVEPDQIRIIPGGKTIKGIIDQTGCSSSVCGTAARTSALLRSCSAPFQLRRLREMLRPWLLRGFAYFFRFPC
jgi:hypothetical protein